MLAVHSGLVTSDIAPQPPSRRRATRQTLAAVAVAVAVGGIGGAAVYAATGGSTHFMTGGMRGPGGFGGQGHGQPPGQGGPLPVAAQGAPGGALHSEYVVSDGHGGFTTKMTQMGTVDEVTPSSVVVRSDDGYTQIYAFPSPAAAPAPSVAADDTVTVAATRTGPTVTLNSIGEGPPRGN
jgi:hypothetical protein